jgi:hypothetical protein
MEKAHRLQPIGLPSIIVFSLAVLTGIWTVLAAQAWVVADPIRSRGYFAVAFFHFIIAIWYSCFGRHWTRWLALTTFLIALSVFGGLCYARFQADSQQLQLAGEVIQLTPP